MRLALNTLTAPAVVLSSLVYQAMVLAVTRAWHGLLGLCLAAKSLIGKSLPARQLRVDLSKLHGLVGPQRVGLSRLRGLSKLRRLSLGLGLGLCSIMLNSSALAGTIRIGATPVPHAEILRHLQPYLATKNITLEIVEYDRYTGMNEDVLSKNLDANFYQGRQYLKLFNQEHNANLQAMVDVHVERMGLYSKFLTDLNKVPKLGMVAIPNDPVTGGCALQLLQEAGLIKLRNPDDMQASVLDIAENPKQLDFLEVEPRLVPYYFNRMPLVAINANFALSTGIKPLRDSLYLEKPHADNVNILVTDLEGLSKPDLQVLAEALSSEDTAEFIRQTYQGVVIPIGDMQSIVDTHPFLQQSKILQP